MPRDIYGRNEIKISVDSNERILRQGLNILESTSLSRHWSLISLSPCFPIRWELRLLCTTHLYALLLEVYMKVCENFIYILNLLFVGLKKNCSLNWSSFYWLYYTDVSCALARKKIIIRFLLFKCEAYQSTFYSWCFSVVFLLRLFTPSIPSPHLITVTQGTTRFLVLMP